MTTILITRIDSGYANVPPTYLIGDHCDGSDALQHEAVEYVLPEGYTIGQDYDGAPIVADPDGRYSPIVDAVLMGHHWCGPSVDWPHQLRPVSSAQEASA